MHPLIYVLILGLLALASAAIFAFLAVRRGTNPITAAFLGFFLGPIAWGLMEPPAETTEHPTEARSTHP